MIYFCLFLSFPLFLEAFVTGAPHPTPNHDQNYLGINALHDIIARRGAPILGFDEGCLRSSKTCDWMRNIPDDTQLVHMNLPGTHDPSTWNYTDATQAALLRYTGPLAPADTFRCHTKSIFQQLDAGIRVFDLRFAWNPGNDTIGFYHSEALLSPLTSLEDVFYGFYSWLDQHPSEAVLVFMKYEDGPIRRDSAVLQQHIYDYFKSDLGRRYWSQSNGSLGTLGEARGKLTLIQRFEYSLLPNTVAQPFGIHLDGPHWKDNSPAFQIIYNAEIGEVAYIEDYYEVTTPIGSSASLNSLWKYNATVAHIHNATLGLDEGGNPDQLYVTFASARHLGDVPVKTPRILAVGEEGSKDGVNYRLLPWLRERRGKRFGIVMLDFFDEPEGLVEAVIGI